jgi:hypothetical protein
MLAIAPYISWNSVEGELALFDERDDRYHALNPSAARIWCHIARQTLVTEIYSKLAQSSRQPISVIKGDVDDFIRNALALGLLVIDDGTAA